MASFEEDWRRFYPTADPTGWMMRSAGAGCWVRFHSCLNQSAMRETHEERDILLARHNSLADEVIGSGRPCWLVEPISDGELASMESESGEGLMRPWPDLGLEHSFRFLSDEGDDEKYAWDVYASPQIWRAGTFDKLLSVRR